MNRLKKWWQDNKASILIEAAIITGLLTFIIGTAILVSCSGLRIEERLEDGSNPKAARLTKSWTIGGSMPQPQQDPLKVDSEGAEIGGTEWTIQESISSLNPLYIIGGIMVVAGVVVIAIFKRWTTGFIIIGGGMLMIA